MKKADYIIKLGIKFSKKYASEYFHEMARPIIIGLSGGIFVVLSQFSPIFAFFALFITIPCICWAFWKGYVITYALNYAAFDFLKHKTSVSFSDYKDKAFGEEKNLAKFVTFIAIVTLLGFFPTALYFIKTISIQSILADPLSAISDLSSVIIFSCLNTFILAPFINYSLQAYFFEKQESYFVLLLNCYKKLNLTGIFFAFVIVGLTTVLSSIQPIIYLFLFLPMNLMIYSINTIWYYTRLEN